MRERPERLRGYFLEVLRNYRKMGILLPKPSDPRYIDMTEQNAN